MKTNNNFLLFVILFFIGALCVPLLEADSISQFLSSPFSWAFLFLMGIILVGIAATGQAMESLKYDNLRKEGRLEELEIEEATRLAAEEEAAESGVDNFWKRMLTKMNDARPIEEEAEIEMDHEYDGIRELDNNLPPWWLWGFYISIAFAVVYLVRYHVIDSAPLQQEEYEQQMAAAEVSKAYYLKNAANLVDETSVTMLTEEPLLKEGAAIFSKSCAVCHAQDGGGGVGPNLTDAYWLHGGGIKDVFATVKYGVPAKGMIPWKDQLSPVEMQKVSSFILTLQGTTPADPKEVQGDLYEAEAGPESAATKAGTDSLELNE